MNNKPATPSRRSGNLTVFCEGMDAFFDSEEEDGDAFPECPYPETSPFHADWWEGFNAAREGPDL